MTTYHYTQFVRLIGIRFFQELRGIGVTQREQQKLTWLPNPRELGSGGIEFDGTL